MIGERIFFLLKVLVALCALRVLFIISGYPISIPYLDDFLFGIKDILVGAGQAASYRTIGTSGL